MKVYLTILGALFVALIFLVPTGVKPRVTHKPTQNNKVVNAKVKDGTLISGNVSYTFGDNIGGSFRDDPRWQQIQGK